MYKLIFLIAILASVLSACHASRASAVHAVVEEEVSVRRISDVDSLSSIISLLSSSLRIDISGLRIDFYPPTVADSVGTPPVRAAPKAISANRVTIADSSDSAIIDIHAVSEADSIDAQSHNTTQNHRTGTSQAGALMPQVQWFICSMVATIAVALLTLYYKFWRKK